MLDRAVAVVVVLLVVASAGCLGADEDTTRETVTPAPVPTDDSHDQVVTTTAAGDDETPTETATVPRLDPTNDSEAREIYRRVTALLGADVPRPSIEYHASSRIEAGEQPPTVPTAVGDVLGPETRSSAGTTVGRVENGTVHLVTGETDVATREYALVYLYTLWIQEEAGWTTSLSERHNGTLDERLVAASITRGVAAYTADTYADRFDLSVERSVHEWAYDWWSAPWLGRVAVESGYRYAAGPLANTSAQVYDDPPNSTEQLLYGFTEEIAPVQPLDVNHESGDWRLTGSERVGELGIRALLSTRLPENPAVTGLRGWGTDRLLVFERGSTPALVWVTTWDDEAFANSFEAAITAYVTSGDVPADHRVDRLDDRTVVLVAGPQGFVEGSTVTGDDRTVDVRTP